MYPKTRLRRLRRTEGMRRLAAETGLSRADLIYPLFAVPGGGRREGIPSMPGVERMSVDLIRERVAGLKSGAILLFGVPDADAKDDTGSSAVRAQCCAPCWWF